MKRTSHKKKGAHLGQHLLINPAVARAVAEAAGISDGDVVLEIGPGTGMLTRELLKLGARVIAVEKDPAMIAVLKESFAKEIAEGKMELREGDARTLTPDKIFPRPGRAGGIYKVAANIPYYITGELIRECLTAQNQPSTLAFLVQKEVAERIARSKKESILSLSVKAYGEPKYVRTVSKGNFNPMPNVDSAILVIRNISRKNFEHVSEEKFFRIVRAGFAQKRKTLGGNLKKVFGERALGALAACGIPEKIRAEDVPLEKWLRLARVI
jgi:16S rRNA (adenine1518-N6/adenine1519-N6)-dimethyltransferase